MSFLFIPGRSARISNVFSNCCRHKTSQLRTDASHNKFVSAQQDYLHHIKVHVPAALAGSVSNVSSGVPERSMSVLTTAERRQCHVLLWRRCAITAKHRQIRARSHRHKCVTQRVVSNLGEPPPPPARGRLDKPTPSQGFSDIVS